jgi:hypothetical protein
VLEMTLFLLLRKRSLLPVRKPYEFPFYLLLDLLSRILEIGGDAIAALAKIMKDGPLKKKKK